MDVYVQESCRYLNSVRGGFGEKLVNRYRQAKTPEKKIQVIRDLDNKFYLVAHGANILELFRPGSNILPKIKLKIGRQQLVNHILYKYLRDALIQYGVFTDHQISDVDSEKTNYQQVQKLLDLLNYKGFDAYIKFVRALRESSMDSAAAFLEDMKIKPRDLRSQKQGFLLRSEVTKQTYEKVAYLSQLRLEAEEQDKNNSLEQQREVYDCKIEQLKTKHADILRKIRDDSDSKVASLQRQLAEVQDQLREESLGHARQIRELEERYQTESAELRAKCEELQASFQAHVQTTTPCSCDDRVRHLEETAELLKKCAWMFIIFLGLFAYVYGYNGPVNI